MPRPRCSPHLAWPRYGHPRSTTSPQRFIRLDHHAITTLAIETSCDDTAVAVLSHEEHNGTASLPSPPSSSNFLNTSTKLLFNERISSDSRAFKGIHPSVTVQGHIASLPVLLSRAIQYLPLNARRGSRQPDFVSVTRGPGIRPNLTVGLSTAKGLALAWNVPLVGVHHMQAHALTPRLVRALGIDLREKSGNDAHQRPSAAAGPDYPFLSLLVSGGHTQLVHSASLVDHRILATSSDIAIGNLLDQTARVILPPDILAASPDVMYGRSLEAFAFPEANQIDYTNPYSFFRPAPARTDEMIDVPSGYDWVVSLPFRQSRRLAYSFSGIYTRVHDIAAAAEEAGGMNYTERRALARHTMRAAFQHLVGRLCIALEDIPELVSNISTLVVAGGVASNRFLMHVLKTTLAVRGFGYLDVVAPPLELCTDNAAMIAWAGMEMYDAGYHTDLSVLPISRWPLNLSDTNGGGLLGVDGWLKRNS